MLKIGLTYLLIVNLLGFFIMLIDKQRAIHKEWRIQEKTLIGISVVGGSMGMLIGMSFFRHKTKHKKFTLGIPTIIIMQFLIFIYYLNSKVLF